MKKAIAPALAAGLLSGGAFLLIAIMGLGFFFMFLPTLPLFYVGLSRNHLVALYGGVIASLIVGTLTDPAVGVWFLICFALPAWYIARQALWWRINNAALHEWYPIGYIMLHITIGACALVALVTLYFMSQGDSIVAVLSQTIHDAFADLQQDYGDVIDLLATQLSFLIFSMTIWLWGLALYAHGWLANRLLIKNTQNIRPDFTVEIFPMPNWVLGLLVICGLASLIGSESLRFLGNSVFIALLLPYFMLGASIMNKTSANWPNRKMFLFFIYFMVFVQFWPALFISGLGLWHHLKHLNKHLSSGGTSFKS